jgi:hypothetical protein
MGFENFGTVSFTKDAKVADFITKHDHRRMAPFTEAEGTAYLRALEALAGAPGLFGNDVHPARWASPTRTSGRPSPP